MSDLIRALEATFSQLGLRSLLDIFIMALIFYWLLLLLRGTTAMSLLRGMVIVLLFGYALSAVFQLTMVSWLLRNTFTALLIAIPIVFQPEIRRALERVGRAGLKGWVTPSPPDRVIDTVSLACRVLSERRHGALMVLERGTGLQEYMMTGVEVDGAASVELILGIFLPDSPLHDGAVILRHDRVAAACCVLPLAESPRTDSRLGLRHRAAIGITERTDAVSIVVSAETGAISIASNGRMVSYLDEGRLRRVLTNLYLAPTIQPFARWSWFKRQS